MKKLLVVVSTIFYSLPALACPICDKKQPALLKGIAHGAGPESTLDYVIVYIMAALVAITMFFAFFYLIKPKEKGNDHIKRTILDFQ